MYTPVTRRNKRGCTSYKKKNGLPSGEISVLRTREVPGETYCLIMALVAFYSKDQVKYTINNLKKKMEIVHLSITNKMDQVLAIYIIHCGNFVLPSYKTNICC